MPSAPTSPRTRGPLASPTCGSPSLPRTFSAGTAQSQVVQGLDAGVTYYFAMLTTDEAYNYSAISNVPAVTMLPPPSTGDTVAPAGIADLHVTATTTSSVTLTWTATGDDGGTGTATLYDMHYSLVNITAANYAGQRLATGLPTPRSDAVAHLPPAPPGTPRAHPAHSP